MNLSGSTAFCLAGSMVCLIWYYLPKGKIHPAYLCAWMWRCRASAGLRMQGARLTAALGAVAYADIYSKEML